MIVKKGSGYQVKSKEGKNLSRVYRTPDEAERRLRQVEWFKSHRVSGGGGKK